MKHEKSVLYTLVLGACMLISLLLIGKMLLYRPAPLHTPHSAPQAGAAETPQADIEKTPQKGEAMYLSETDLAAKLSQQLPQDFPVSGLAVAIAKDGTVRAQGTLQKSALEAVPELRAVLRWLPDEFALDATFSATCDAARLTLAPRELRVSGFAMPTESLPQDWLTALNTAANAALTADGQTFSQIRLCDGGVQLMP